MARPQKRCLIFNIFLMLALSTDALSINPSATVVKSSFSHAITSLYNTLQHLHSLISLAHDVNTTAPFNDCIENIESAVDHVNASLIQFSSSNSTVTEDVITWLSAALTHQTTCLDGIQGLQMKTLLSSQLSSWGQSNTNLLSKILALVTAYKSKNLHRHRRLFSHGDHFVDEVPTWVPADHRRLLQVKNAEVTYNVEVARDGRARHKTIQAAVDEAPLNSISPYVIKIKAGVYREQVIVPKEATNLVFVGDGIGKTIISGSRNVQQIGVTTFNSATLIINGDNFLGMDFTVKNNAGPAKHQAVAVRVSADKVTFYRSEFRGFQDTLYAHSLRQFYRECIVLGSVDFIFGNGAVVLQNSIIIARVGNPGQQIVFTAQGRTDKNQNTGLSFHNCRITGTSSLRKSISQHPCYLGRPWKLYSRTVFMLSFLDYIIHPSGWLPWSGDFALRTLYYGEFANYGPGSSRPHRVPWSTSMSRGRAHRFTVKHFIQGKSWIPPQIPYRGGL